MPHTSEIMFRRLLGPSLQGGAVRMVLGLGVFSAIGAGVAWLVIR